MKILFLAHRIPYPPDKGEKIRAFHELKFLATRHKIDLFCFADSAKDAAGAQELRQLCRHVYVEILSPFRARLGAVRGLWRKPPLSAACFFSPTFQAAVRRALERERYDLIFVYCAYMSQYVPQPSPVPVVIDFVDVDSGKLEQYAKVSPFPLSWLYAREARSLSRYEKQLAATTAANIVATPQEAAQLDGNGCFSVEVIRNGVSLPPAQSRVQLPDSIRRLQPYVLFVGTMDYLPNADAVVYFTEQILPRIRQRHPELRFVIAGRNPARRVRALARQPGVVVTGAIPDVYTYLMGAGATVAPFRICQGVQNKILEAMAAGVPVVSTSRPALAIGAADGESLLVADTPEEFASAVISVLEDPKLRVRLHGSAELIRRHFDWDTNLSQLERLLECRAGLSQNREGGKQCRAEAS